ncbi:MAG TPA: putative Ig domain-containing protein [Nitrospiraceae bacterium]|nr:putative Ig domain-containing protein [Nitrospiraceae bacterium]
MTVYTAASEELARNRRFRAFASGGARRWLPVAFALFSGCFSHEEGGEGGNRLSGDKSNRSPVVKEVAILPTPVVLSSPLTVRVEAQDLDLNTLTFRYRWLVNGQVIAGQTRESLQPELLKRGDQVAVEVTPFDGTIEGAAFRSAAVSVVNTPPIIYDVSLDFDHDAQGRQLLAKVDVIDPDHDAVSLTYRWRKNEAVLKEGEERTLDLAGLTAKDAIQVDVKASDGTPDGIVTVTQRFALSNSYPTIVSTPSPSPKGEQYDYLVKATDADGDPITYELELAPPGMTIEAKTGQIHWGIRPDLIGASHRVRVIAKDSQGGFAKQEFDLSLTAATKS